MSLPSRERGLKWLQLEVEQKYKCVAPLAGAWIEIIKIICRISGGYVAPLAGAWIEINFCLQKQRTAEQVAPLAGAWIEI